MVGQARRNAGQSVIVKVQFSQVGDISQCAIFHRADLIVAQTQPVGEKNQKVDETWKHARARNAQIALVVKST